MLTTTSIQRKSKNSSVSHQTLSELGLTKEKLEASDQMEQDVSIMLMTSRRSLESNNLSITQQSVMQESALNIKNMTLNDKSNSYNQSTQMHASLKTSDQDLIGNDQVLQPFWNQCTKVISEQLWSPIKTDYVDLETNLLNGSSKRLMLNSWFSAKVMTKKTPLENSQKTYLQSQLSSLHATTALEQDTLDVREKKTQLRKAKQEEKKQKALQMTLSKETCKERAERVALDKAREEKRLKLLQNKELKKQKALANDEEYIDLALKKSAGKSKSIQVYFSKEQKQTLKKWFGVTRFIYNKCLDEINKSGNKNLKYLREKCINNKNYTTENTWMLNYHYDLRDEALRDLLKNIKSNEAKEKKFKMKFKSRKDEYVKGASISVLSKYWNKGGAFKEIYHTSNIKCNEKLPNTLMYSSRLKKTTTNKYFLCIPTFLNENQVKNDEKGMIFIDPGSKCFLTGYDPSGKIIVWGENDVGRIARLQHYKRKIQKQRSLNNNKKKRRLRLAELRIGEKISNLVLDMHKKLSKWLCENYTKIYIPRLNFHKMKRLHSKEKAKLAALSHCAFVDRLIWKSREYECDVYEVNEDFTSKTCSHCGFLKKDLKGRTFECDACNKVFDRDINASKNIMLKHLTKRATV